MRPPPGHVSGIAKRAAHHRTAAFLRVSGRVSQDRNRPTKQGHARRSAHHALVAGIFWMNKDRHAGRQQLGAGGGNWERATIFQPEIQGDKLGTAFDIT